MMLRMLTLLVAVVGCEPKQASSIKVISPVSTVAAVSSEPQVPALVSEVKLALVPTTRVAVGQNIWLESVKTPEQALASTVSDALNVLGARLSIGDALSRELPKQPVVSWQSRTAGIERRVILELEVVLTKGFLEHLISRSEAAKDHESILSSSFDAEMLHTAMLGAGLQPGKPAKFINEKRELDFKPATGETVKIYFEYVDAGKLMLVPAQSWVVYAKDGKPLTTDWVYAGSFKGKSTTANGEEFIYFGANDGRVVCLTNFSTALLDLPIESADSDPQGDNLGFKAKTEAIPERGTKVRAIFEAAPKKK